MVEIRRRCERLHGINLASGTCELPIPPEIAVAADAAIRAGYNTYSFPEGISDLRRVIVDKLRRHNAISVQSETEVAVTGGATLAYAAAIVALLDPGDEILLLEPFYSWHRDTAKMLGVIPRFARLQAPGFRITVEAVRASVTERTRAIVLCSPGNPTGRVYSEEELTAIAEVSQKHDLFVISDEIYEYLVYDGRKHLSARALPSLADRAVSIMGLSKTFNVTGWRLGYVVARPELAQAITTAHEYLSTCAPTPLQHAAIAALSLPESYYAQLRESHERRRDLLVSTLESIGMTPLRPEGAYYVLAGISKLEFESPTHAAHELLERTGVACVPDTAFYQTHSGGFLRFCFARDDDQLAEGCRRLKTLCSTRASA
jgi:aminotransferase